MTSRRTVLGGLFAAGLSARASWADAGSPSHVTAALRPDGTHTLCGLTDNGALAFEVPLPARGHAAAAHPVQPHVVAFARRPGTFAFVLDCITGAQLAHLSAPEGRHFYGHGVFSAGGSYLYTTENDYAAARGVIGIWDVGQGYRRLGEVPSGGVGPHDIRRMPGRDILVVANGGIETHPDSGRAKLNLPTMAANLSYIAPDGALLDRVTLGREHQLNSIRHLDVRPDGTVAFALQWQGDPYDAPALLGLHNEGSAPRLLMPDTALHDAMQGYAGSVAFSRSGGFVGITSPRGGMVQIFNSASGGLVDTIRSEDACGLSPHAGAEFSFTNGTGAIALWQVDAAPVPLAQHARAFDNHLVRL